MIDLSRTEINTKMLPLSVLLFQLTYNVVANHSLSSHLYTTRVKNMRVYWCICSCSLMLTIQAYFYSMHR